MKKKVKTLRGVEVPIELEPEDSVADVKKKIEMGLGADIYPAAQQILIHRNRVLSDVATMQESDVRQDSDLISVLSKATPPIIAPALTTPAPNSTVSGDVSGNNFEAVIDQIIGHDYCRWDRDTIARAVRAAPGNDINQAVSYLIQGKIDKRAMPVPTGEPKFQALRAMLKTNPHMLQMMLQELKKQKPNLVGLIEENQADALSLFCEPVEGDEESLLFTIQELLAISTLEEMGFSKSVALKVFVACNKNKDVAAEFLGKIDA